MKYFYIEVMLLLIKIFDLMPMFLIKWVSFFGNRNFYKHIAKFKTLNNNSKKILIWMDYSNAIGDFFIILNSIVKYDQLGVKYSVLVHSKFRGIIEQCNLKNIEIIYKENSLGKHYLKDEKNLLANINNIEAEFLHKNLFFDKIFYFNGILLADALTAIKNIQYNELIMINPKVFLRGKKSKFIDRNFVSLSLFYLTHCREFKISTIPNSNLSLTEIIENLFCLQNIKYNGYNFLEKGGTIISAGASNATKVLKQKYLLKIIDDNVHTNKKIFVGSNFDKKFVCDIVDTYKNEFLFQFDLQLKELFDLVKNSDLVVSYDTGIFHIANFLNKKIILIINEKDFAYKYMHKYWLGDNKENIKMIVLKKQCFNKK